MKKQNKLQLLVKLALLIALVVICSRYISIEIPPAFKFSLTYLPLSIMGALFGPFWTMIGNVSADFIGMWIAARDTFFFGFTINAFVTGLIYGFFLYKKPKSWLNIIIVALLINFGVNLFMTTYWIHLMYHTPFIKLLVVRFPSECLQFVLQVITMKLFFKYLPKI